MLCYILKISNELERTPSRSLEGGEVRFLMENERENLAHPLCRVGKSRMTPAYQCTSAIPQDAGSSDVVSNPPI
jgi:hypothetical protein